MLGRLHSLCPLPGDPLPSVLCRQIRIRRRRRQRRSRLEDYRISELNLIIIATDSECLPQMAEDTETHQMHRF